MTLASQGERRERIEAYRTQGLRYFENALELFEKREWEKGAEVLWGALAEALKAYALSQDRLLRSHGELRRFAMAIQDEEIRNAFVRAERLHADFYERSLDPENIADAVHHIRVALGKVLTLIETTS